MIIVDTGFLYALLDGRDAWHARALAQRDTAELGWITTWPVLTECSHLLNRSLGPDFVVALVDDVASGGIQVWQPPDTRLARMAQLMRKYRTLPMDVADASLVLLAEHLGHGRILSTDLRDFGTYRWKNHKPFDNRLEAA